MRDAQSNSLRWLSRGLGPLALIALTGCLPFLRTPQVPLETLELSTGEATTCLAILLPGRFGGPQNYVKAGFADAVEERGLALDLIAVDAHFGYYRDRSIVDRLREDVVGPAQARGYDEIWMVGASMGGLGTVLYTREHGDDLSGGLALAPFLGKGEIIEEIRDRGGPRAWAEGADVGDDDFHKIWRWLVNRPEDGTPLYLAFGTDDRLANANRLWAELLPEERVSTTSGGHDWKVWRGLWDQFLTERAPCSSVH